MHTSHLGWPLFGSRISVYETKNVACLVLKEPILWGAEEFVDASRHTLEVAKAALALPEGALIVSEQGVVAAQVIVDRAEATFSAGLKAAAAEFIAKLGINSLISIQKISFDVSLDAISGGSFSGSVTAVFAGASEASEYLL